MERTMQTTRRYKRTRQPRRIVLLWLVCLFAAVSFGVLLAISLAAKALLRSEGGAAPAVAPVEGREMPGVIDAPFIDQRDKYPLHPGGRHPGRRRPLEGLSGQPL